MKPIGYLNTKNHSKTIMFIIKWFLVVSLLLGLIFALKSYVKSTEKKELEKYNKLQVSYASDFRKSLESSNKSAYNLVLLGRKLLENKNPKWAIIFLETAAKKDPKYRDAALFAGYANLSYAKELENKKTDASAQYKNAKNYLEKARGLDSINPYTFQLLAIAYEHVGDAENSALCYNKFKELQKK